MRIMYEEEIVKAFTERIGLREDQARHAVQIISDVVDEEESKQEPSARGEFFKDTVISHSTGVLRFPPFARLRCILHRVGNRT